MQGGVKLIAFFLPVIIMLGSCRDYRHHREKIVLPPPFWEIWDDPGTVLGMDVTDPKGDHLGFGLVADWALMKGAYDFSYVYIHVDVHSSPDLDAAGGVIYKVLVDTNDSGDLDTGDFILTWNLVNGFMVEDFSGAPSRVEALFQLGTEGGLDFAVPRYLVNPDGFGVYAYFSCWRLTDFEPGDIMPDAGETAPFQFE